MPTWIDLPGEATGSLKKTDQWSRSTLSAMSRGYEVAASPLQVLAAYAALANGGLLVSPHIVKERRDVTNHVIWKASTDSVRRAFKISTADTLLPAFEAAVNSGTATRARIPGVRVAGKTGTAMKVQDGQYAAGAYRASFVGLFPAEKPTVVMLVLMDEPSSSIYGGSVAAPVFHEIATRWMPTLEHLPEVADSLGTEPATPALTRMPLAIAARTARANGFSPMISRGTATDIVSEQVPSSQAALAAGDRIRLKASAQDSLLQALGDAPISARDKVFWHTAAGNVPRVSGGRTRAVSGSGR
jgi:cell division protein FtsI (penicillin-binding protein 3)